MQPEHDPPAEFDAYAADYDAGLDCPLRRWLGKDAESFIEVKAAWLLRELARKAALKPAHPPPRLLDYGCGAGAMLRVLRRLGFAGTLVGCDVSAQMLKEARRRWREGPLPELAQMEDGRAPFRDNDFDLVVLSAVLHHVETPQRARTYADVLRVLKPGGLLYVFEHNPFNPLARWVVRRTPIDRSAVLLTPREVRAGLTSAGAGNTRTAYLMFFPPRLTWLRRLERLLQWLPCGAQYVVVAGK
jgi:SAM-dependent methyltransferase